MRRKPILARLLPVLALMVSHQALAQIETLVMPGKVIAGHADLESECKNCHVKFERSRQRELCLDCHEDVARDIEARLGFHGKTRQPSERECAYCHTDHEGRDADILGLDPADFDHQFTDFELLGKHAEAECETCHAPDTKFRDAPGACFDCHEEDNVHDTTMGTECGDCHTPTDWKEVEFDHATTDYPLIGKHREAACLDCHADQTFQSTPTTCYDCHAEDDAHEGRSGRECGNCHSPTGWQDTSFDHTRDTDFELLGRHAELTCDDCHSEDPFADQLETACIACHEEDDNHEGHFGASCDSCHGSDEWALVRFDHDRDTDYALRGAHKPLECITCHVEPIFEVALEMDCNSCHANDDPHEGTQGDACNDCHNEDAWDANVFFDHDLTRFPLLGLHAEVECLECHETQRFRDTPSACVDCHRDDDKHEDRFSDNCGTCHSPAGWPQWRFDHDTLTDFPLLGAHKDVACESCHRQSLTVQMRFGESCGDCHRADDVHNGEFGADCGRCHSANSFEEVQRIQ